MVNIFTQGQDIRTLSFDSSMTEGMTVLAFLYTVFIVGMREMEKVT